MSDDDKVVYLAFSNDRVDETSMGVRVLSCKTCRNKTWVAQYAEGRNQPALVCAACRTQIGLFGWLPEDEEVRL